MYKSPSDPPDLPKNTARTVGFYAALLTTLLTVMTFVIAFLTPPLSGPGCQGSCFEYPDTDIVPRFPRNDWVKDPN